MEDKERLEDSKQLEKEVVNEKIVVEEKSQSNYSNVKPRSEVVEITEEDKIKANATEIKQPETKDLDKENNNNTNSGYKVSFESVLLFLLFAQIAIIIMAVVHNSSISDFDSYCKSKGFHNDSSEYITTYNDR